MQTLRLADDQELTGTELLAARLPLGFWKRQFHLEPTYEQKEFDWAFGVVLPLICIAADPLVFDVRIGSFNQAILAEYKIFAYVLSSVSVLAMVAWLLWGQRLGELRPYIGGLFLAGSIISLIVGVILLPFSLIGMFLIIGLLGFTPLFSSFVFLRNGVRAINGSKMDSQTWVVYRAVIIAAIYSLIVPLVLNF